MPVTSHAISAANATIEVAGREVGRIQSLNASVNYNLQEIRNLWQSNMQSFARGVQTITVTARRAIIDVESVFGDGVYIQELASKIDNLTSWIPDATQAFGWGNFLTQSSIDYGKDFAATALQLISDRIPINAAPDIKNLQDLLENIKNGASSIADFFSRVPFDILVKTDTNGFMDGQSIVSSFAAPQVLWKFSDCRVAARSLSLDINSIILMEEITTYAREFSEPALMARILKGS